MKSSIVAGLCFLFGCAGVQGVPVEGYDGIYAYAQDDVQTIDRIKCAMDLVATRVAGSNTPWSAEQVQFQMYGAQILVKDAWHWRDCDNTTGKCIQVDETSNQGYALAGDTIQEPTITVNKVMTYLAHGWRHMVAYRLTGDAQADHAGWNTQILEIAYGRDLERFCPQSPNQLVGR